MTDPSPLPDPAEAAYARGKAEAYETLAVRVLIAAGTSVGPGYTHRSLALAAVDSARELKEERDDALAVLQAILDAGGDLGALEDDLPHPGPDAATGLAAEIHRAMGALREVEVPAAPLGLIDILERAAIHIIEERDRRAAAAFRRLVAARDSPP